MTFPATISNPTQLLRIVPREYEVFGGLDVDHHSIAVTFADHGRLMHRCGYPIVRRSYSIMCANIFRDT
jgi:hypothetical protein